MTDHRRILLGDEIRFVPLLVLGDESVFANEVRAGVYEVLCRVEGCEHAFRFVDSDTFATELAQLHTPDYERESGVVFHPGIPWWVVEINPQGGAPAVGAHAPRISRWAVRIPGFGEENLDPDGEVKWSYWLDDRASPYYGEGRLARAFGAYLANAWLAYCRNPQQGDAVAWGVHEFKGQRALTLALVEEYPDWDYHRAHLCHEVKKAVLSDWLEPVEQPVEFEPLFEEVDVLNRGLLPQHFSTRVVSEEKPDPTDLHIEAPSGSWWRVGFIGDVGSRVLQARKPSEMLVRLREMRTWLYGAEGGTLITLGNRGLRTLLTGFTAWRKKYLTQKLDASGFLHSLNRRSARITSWLETMQRWTVREPKGLRTFDMNEVDLSRRIQSVPNPAAGILRLVLIWIPVGWIAWYAFRAGGLPVPSHWIGWGILSVAALLTLIFCAQSFLSRLFRERAFQVTLRDLGNEYLVSVMRGVFVGWKEICAGCLAPEREFCDALRDVAEGAKQMLQEPVPDITNRHPLYGDEVHKTLFSRMGSSMKERVHQNTFESIDVESPGREWLDALDEHTHGVVQEALNEVSYMDLEVMLEFTNDQRAGILENLARNATRFAFDGQVMRNSHSILLANEGWDDPEVLRDYDRIEVRTLPAPLIRLIAIAPLVPEAKREGDAT